MIFTNCGLLGDMFLCLPVISWYYKHTGDKPVFALADHFPYSRNAEHLLRMQECISDVVYFKFDESQCFRRTADNLGPYHVPKDLFRDTPYENHDITSLGFYRWPDKYIPAFYAEEHGMGVDYDFRLNYGEPNYYYQERIVKVDKFESPRLGHVDAFELPSYNSMQLNLQYAAGAKEIVTFTTGFSIMVTLARIPVTIWQPANLVQHHSMYFDINGGIKWRMM